MLVPAAKDRRDVATRPAGHRHVPSGPLAAFVDRFWLYDGYGGAHASERVLPTATTELVVPLRDDRAGPVICGAFSESFVIDTADRHTLVGVHFKPGGAFPFLPMPAGEIHNVHLTLDVLWGRRAHELRDRLAEARTSAERFDIVERMLLQQLRRPLVRHPAVTLALAEFDSAPHVGTIAQLVRRVGLSARRFIELFTNEVGITPKRFCRVRRFQRALAMLHDSGPARGLGASRLATIALDCGYYDQSHFVREFRALAGLTPSAYARMRTELRNHVPIAR